MYSRAQTVGAVRISFKKLCSSWMRWAKLGSAKAPRLRGTLFMSNMVVAHEIARQNDVSNTVLQTETRTTQDCSDGGAAAERHIHHLQPASEDLHLLQREMQASRIGVAASRAV
jgi:hypothetical protein